jgi:hypothetical protein
MARRSKYTPELVRQICEILAEGNPRRTACVLAGVSEETFYTWLRAKPEFSEAIKKAEEEAIRRNVGIVQSAAREHWQAAAWWLERKAPDEFGQRSRQTVEVTGPDGGPVQHEHSIPESAIIAFADYLRDGRSGAEAQGEK